MRYRTLTQPWLNLASTLLQHCLNLASALPQLHHDMTVFVTSTETEIPQAKTIINLIYIYYRRAPALYIHCCNNNIPLWQIAHMWWHSRILDTLESLYAIAYIYSHSEFAFRNPYKSHQYNFSTSFTYYPRFQRKLKHKMPTRGSYFSWKDSKFLWITW